MGLVRNLFAMLTAGQKRSFGRLQVLFCVTALLQVAGAAAIAPFVGLLSNAALIHQNPVFSYFYRLGGFHDDVSYMVACSVIVMATISVSNLALAVSTRQMFFFSIATGQEFQRAIFRNYLHKDYAFFGRKNSSELISIVTQESPRLVYNVLIPLLNLTTQVLMIALMIAGLLWLDWVVAVSAMVVVGGGYGLVYRMVRGWLSHHGRNLGVANDRRLRLLTESLGGVKEVKLLGTEHFYEEQIAATNEMGLRSTAIIGLCGDIPKYVLETIAFCAMLGLSTWLLVRRGWSNDIVTMLSLYAMAGYKLLPAAQAIFKSVSLIRANGEVVPELMPQVLGGRALTLVAKPAELPVEAAGQSAQLQGDIRLTNVTYRYPGAHVPTLKKVSLLIPRNSLVVLVGPSGAGKSTLADILLGLLPPTEGRLQVGETTVDATNVRSWQRQLGYVPQSIFLLDDSIAANIGFGIAAEVDRAAVATAAALANIDEFIDTLPGKYDYRVGERGALLSGGQKQRIGIARSLYRNADVLIMDEATSALDSITEREIMTTIAGLKANKTIVMIAHRLSTIRSADMILFVNDGTIHSCGTFDELAQRDPLFRRVVLANSEAEATAA
jgi:ABC-type multidrug transport system fused ATPase/permease subunit